MLLTAFVTRIFGLAIAWRLRHQSKGEWLSANRTQKGTVERSFDSDLFRLAQCNIC